MRRLSLLWLIPIACGACATAADARDEARVEGLTARIGELRSELSGVDRDLERAFTDTTRATRSLDGLRCAAITAERPAALPKDKAAVIRFQLDKNFSVRPKFSAAQTQNGRAVHPATCEVTSP